MKSSKPDRKNSSRLISGKILCNGILPQDPPKYKRIMTNIMNAIRRENSNEYFDRKGKK